MKPMNLAISVKLFQIQFKVIWNFCLVLLFNVGPDISKMWQNVSKNWQKCVKIPKCDK